MLGDAKLKLNFNNIFRQLPCNIWLPPILPKSPNSGAETSGSLALTYTRFSFLFRYIIVEEFSSYIFPTTRYCEEAVITFFFAKMHSLHDEKGTVGLFFENYPRQEVVTKVCSKVF